MARNFLSLFCCLLFVLLLFSPALAVDQTPFTLVVMDPLALPLSCPCVKGYAQRDYDKLGLQLQRYLGRPVQVYFSESLGNALEHKTDGKADLVIGKDSVIRHQSKAAGLKLSPLVSLTGKDGSTTMTGLFVVAAIDQAIVVEDLKGYQLILGPADSDEKHAAAMALLRDHGVPIPSKFQISTACSDGATAILALHKEGKKATTVISSYAKPLLEGCGTVNKGDLRVIGETKPVPFITAFINEKIPQQDRAQVLKGLLEVGNDPALCTALETKKGFVKAAGTGSRFLKPTETTKNNFSISTLSPSPLAVEGRGGGVKPQRQGEIPLVPWTAWRGPNHDGRVSWLPEKLTAKPNIIWEKALTTKTLGGIAATQDHVLYSDRELNDTADAFYCVHADTGKTVWSLVNPAPGTLDYGNSPRATPLIHENLVILANAFGVLQCVEIRTGNIVWGRDLREEFQADDERKWGMCSSPFLADGKLIVNPGAKKASLVALDPHTGKTVWQTPGSPASYGNFIVGAFGGVKQIVGHDFDSLGGWDLQTGKRLWTITPARPGDFNVPTPIQVGEKLLVSTENNGTRLYCFQKNGLIDTQSVVVNRKLSPNTHTPVAINSRLFGVHKRFYCLDLNQGLNPLWVHDDEAFAQFASVIASEDRLLIVSFEGEVILCDAKSDAYRELGRWKLFLNEQAGYAHPALVGSRLYLRGNASIICIEMKG